MSVWQRLRERLFGDKESASESTEEAAAEDRPDEPPIQAVATLKKEAEPEKDPPEIIRLSQVGLPKGPSEAEALLLLRKLRGTVNESLAVSRVLAATLERNVYEPVRIASADILASRGDERGAIDALRGTSSTAALMLAADLYASLGQVPRALSTIERVLAWDFDAPGARERHARWRASVGAAPVAKGRLDEATVVTDAGAKAPYRLLREVARGGAGAVYEAEDELLGQRVAFKVYHQRGKDREHLEREARMAIRHRGPGVIRIFDADPDDGWVSLEWIARGSVRDLLARGDGAALLPIARWAIPLGQTLARLHEAGLVHADVKPANVLLREPGDPVLGDFGIARPVGTAYIGGSAGYMSPERIAGRVSDPRDDVYGFGRVVEDVLHRLGSAAGVGEEWARWRGLAETCLGADEQRPASGTDLVKRLRQAGTSTY
jgi:eukaryotic-like serine/threonine-protein kinase